VARKKGELTTGPINFATQKICIGRGLAAIRAMKLIDKEFLFNFLLKHESEIVGNTGADFNSINKAQIEAIEIPIPPLPEQQRIVAVLDIAFAAIAKAKANAAQNLKNAKELFESYLQGVFENKGDGWESKELMEVCEQITDGKGLGGFSMDQQRVLTVVANYRLQKNEVESVKVFLDGLCVRSELSIL
jgi:type I restriction enzyme S subunit